MTFTGPAEVTSTQIELVYTGLWHARLMCGEFLFLRELKLAKSEASGQINN